MTHAGVDEWSCVLQELAAAEAVVVVVVAYGREGNAERWRVWS